MRPLATGALAVGAGVVGGVVNVGAGAGGGTATTGPLKLGGGSVSITAGDEQPAAASTPMAQSEIVSREIFKAILGPLLFNDNVADDDKPDACPELPGIAEPLRQILPSKRRST
jgi:hypothetical protein